MRAFLRAAVQASEKGEAVDLPIVSVSLLTPVKLPGTKDRDLLADQLSTFNNVNKMGKIAVRVPNPNGMGQRHSYGEAPHHSF